MTGLQHRDDQFETPDWVFEQIERNTGLVFTLDMCASLENSKCDDFIDEEINALKHYYSFSKNPIFCNPPRSKNGKFVDKVYEIWKQFNYDIVMLLCWNDLGNKYGEKILDEIVKGKIITYNLGKVKFYKNGIESKYPSRLTYFWAWFKHEK